MTTAPTIQVQDARTGGPFDLDVSQVTRVGAVTGKPAASVTEIELDDQTVRVVLGGVEDIASDIWGKARVALMLGYHAHIRDQLRRAELASYYLTRWA